MSKNERIGSKAAHCFSERNGRNSFNTADLHVCMSRYGKQNVIHVLMAEAALKFPLTSQNSMHDWLLKEAVMRQKK
jgi:hypothetical protein